MSKKYEKLAQDIVEKIGGSNNIHSLHHCQTRLRFQLLDDNKADIKAVELLGGVAKVIVNGGMFQVVIGMHVAEVYEEVVKYMDPQEHKEECKEKKKLFDIVTEFISSIFSPIVPALAGAGMVKALLALLIAFKWITNTDQTYVIINMISDATFAFMPILLAYSTAQKLKCSPTLAAVTAGIMCHATWGNLVGAGEAVQLFGFLPLYLVKYTGSVIPIVLVILIQAPFEKWLNKVVPNAIRLVIVPMILFLVMGVLALSIVGPFGDYIGKGLTILFTWLSTNVSWAPALFIGGLYPLLVIFGLHHGLAPIGTMQMAQMGYDAVFGPGVLCANIGQGTASLVAGYCSKDIKTKQIGISAGITGLMGITEPALYGINLPKKYPLIAGLIGSACGGLFAGITHTHRFATGSSGLPAAVMYIGDNTMQFFYQIIIALTITILVSAISTFILAKKYEKEKISHNIQQKETLLSKQNTNKCRIIASPVSGKIIPLEEVHDKAFSSHALGDGIGIEPTSGEVISPANGTILTLFPTKHAVGILTDDGIELLIHIGLNTVELNGQYFKALVQQGDKVVLGQPLISFDLIKLKEKGYDTQIPIIITNTKDFKRIEVKAINNVIQQEQLMQVIV